ncbi:MAG: hypothetical protein AAFV53_07685 [Myxococcota bacterium]
MAIHFQDLNDLQDPRLMKSAIRELRKNSGKFFYSTYSTALDGPALIVIGPGGRLAPDVKRAVKKGGVPIKGKFQTDRWGRLVLLVNREVNRSEMAESVRSIAKGYGVSIPLQDIVIRTPSDRKRARLRRAQKAAGKKRE